MSEMIYVATLAAQRERGAEEGALLSVHYSVAPPTLDINTLPPGGYAKNHELITVDGVRILNMAQSARRLAESEWHPDRTELRMAGYMVTAATTETELVRVAGIMGRVSTDRTVGSFKRSVTMVGSGAAGRLVEAMGAVPEPTVAANLLSNALNFLITVEPQILRDGRLVS